MQIIVLFAEEQNPEGFLKAQTYCLRLEALSLRNRKVTVDMIVAGLDTPV